MLKIENTSANAVCQNLGIQQPQQVYYNVSPSALIEYAVAHEDAHLTEHGALLALTGKHTGRSAKDKFIVKDDISGDKIWRENNPELTVENFDLLYDDICKHLNGKNIFIQDLFAGADTEHRLNVRMVTQYAWHSLFIRHLLRRPTQAELTDFIADFTVINVPEFQADPARHGCRSETVIALSFEKKCVLICGTEYAGENKKSVFTILNYLLPEKGIFPMHCSANHAKDDPDNAAIFFGLSGTGKTTLSADSSRVLIGDDEHGWSDKGLFNFEGGCYAKTIRLSAQGEAEIFAATQKFGSVLENVVMDAKTRKLDFNDTAHTENTRVAYPLEAIPNASATGISGNPRHVVMLTCDAFGILPPLAKLSPAQAVYHFLSGFTSKVAGTEKGITEPQPTFSTCFGAPFMPLRPVVYGELLHEKIMKHDAQCWLLNTGWTGGAYGVGQRMPLKETRALLQAVLEDKLLDAEFRMDPNFGFQVPLQVDSVDASLLDPRQSWSDSTAYDAQAQKLVQMFVENFKQYETQIEPSIQVAALIA